MTAQACPTCGRLPECPSSSKLTPWVDAAAVAAHFGVSRDYVYRHADALGAVELPGGGKKPRLRFNLDRVAAAIAGSSSKTSQDVESPDAAGDCASERPHSNRRNRRNPPQRRLDYAPLYDSERKVP